VVQFGRPAGFIDSKVILPLDRGKNGGRIVTGSEVRPAPAPGYRQPCKHYRLATPGK
jgi:hypothetical protein